MRRATTLAACLALAVPALASAQTRASASDAQVNQGPMTIERVHSGFLAAPDAKVTDFDGRTRGLIGGYAGWLTDDTFFVGGGGYWLPDTARDRRLAYGGLVLQWLTRTNDRVGFTAKTLIGGGEARLSSTITQIVPVFDPRTIDRGRNDAMPPRATTTTRTSTVSVDRGFFVAEPEVGVLLRVARHVRVTGGVGYRLVSAEGRTDDRIRGVTGTVGVQIGGGS